MKIIVSHDVDHLFRDDHYRDLIYPKLWVRSTLELVRGYYGCKEWLYRMATPFSKKRHKIEDVMKFDKEQGVPSSFFFGMANGLGMSYKKERAVDVIRMVDNEGFDVGVHGIEYESIEGMKKEFDDFKKIIGREDFGIRMHYVRFNDKTFENLSKCNYLFDTTEFDKKKGHLFKEPYRIGRMWEFPLSIMDGYLPLNLDDKKRMTIDLVNEADKLGISYLTILFHDYQFCEGYATERDWYKWAIRYLGDKYGFISYRDAIKELEDINDDR